MHDDEKNALATFLRWQRASVLAIVFAARAGLRTAWAISGFVTGLAAALVVLVCDALLFLA